MDERAGVCAADSLRQDDTVHKDIIAVQNVIWPAEGKRGGRRRPEFVKCLSVQQQKGGKDCGPFALAFAEVMARGGDVEQTHFDQSKMRQHLIDCARSVPPALTPFPLGS